jgi:hypothetical protein
MGFCEGVDLRGPLDQTVEARTVPTSVLEFLEARTHEAGADVARTREIRDVALCEQFGFAGALAIGAMTHERLRQPLPVRRLSVSGLLDRVTVTLLGVTDLLRDRMQATLRVVVVQRDGVHAMSVSSSR